MTVYVPTYKWREGKKGGEIRGRDGMGGFPIFRNVVAPMTNIMK